MVKAATEAATAASGGTGDMIGKVVKVANAGAAAKGGDATSVNGIADGIKGIVEAAKKSGVDGLKDVQAAKEEEKNKDAGKLFTGKKDAGGAAKEAEKAAAAVSGVSGEQILSAIVTAAGAADQDGEKPADATNPIAAAIGKGNADNGADFGKDEMKKDDQIAAAIALRGMAKDGKFAVKKW